jgi:endoribonuclease LACTB2
VEEMLQQQVMENLLTLTVNSTHFYLIDCKGGKLLVDAGWGMGQFAGEMKAHKVAFAEIRYVMFTHHHPDHAGLVQEIKARSGAKLIIHEKQIPFLENLRQYGEKKGGILPVRVEKDDLVSPGRATLQGIGIQGEIVETAGHSDDSISLVLDSGAAFIGDLAAPEFSSPESYDQTRESWERLLERNVKTFYHSHAGMIPAERIREALGRER